MANLPPISDFTGSSVTKGGFKAATASLRTYLYELFVDDSANKVAARAALAVPLNATVGKTGAYTAVAGDCGRVLNCTGTWTLTLTSALTLGDAWNVTVANTGTGVITVATSLSQLIDGAASITVQPGCAVLIYCSGALFVTIGGAGGVPTGATMDFVGSTAPTGWVLLSGRTIGSASSGATERASADTEALFTLLWNSMGNSEAAVSGGRGASAAADFAANKTIALPDARGRVIAGKDNMGGTAATRLDSGGAGIAATTLGAAGGSQTVTLTSAQSGLPEHTHNVSLNINSSGGGSEIYFQHSTRDLSDSGATTVASQSNSASSASSAHQNVQPTLVLNKIIKL